MEFIPAFQRYFEKRYPGRRLWANREADAKRTRKVNARLLPIHILLFLIVVTISLKGIRLFAKEITPALTQEMN